MTAILAKSRRVLLISTYDLGRQPFGLASPAAWLRADGAEVACLDLSCQPLRDNEAAVQQANLIAFYLPMHTAMRIALHALPRVQRLNPRARLCAYGLYAPLNPGPLRSAGITSILGGEFETALVALSRQPAARHLAGPPAASSVSLVRQKFLVPDRTSLAALQNYARLALPDGRLQTVGYTEGSRGCKHLCRHCPVVPVYNGRFRIVQPEVVLADIDQQVSAGAQHITFGDPDFFNGIKHAVAIITQLHRRHPALTYDVTIKVEHLLKHAEYLPLLRETGCALVTTAVESLDDRVLQLLRKGHTRADFYRIVDLARAAGLALAPTFVAFTPWISLAGYHELLSTLAELGLVANVAPVQLTIRLLITDGSPLLELDEVRDVLGPFVTELLSYRWLHPDPRVDALQREVAAKVESLTRSGASRSAIFDAIWDLSQHALSGAAAAFPQQPPRAARVTIPYLTEPWYC